MHFAQPFTAHSGGMITPAQHAVLDYSVAATFFGLAATLAPSHRRASMLAAINGAMVLGMSLLTDYPGGVFRKISFKAHRNGDIVQAQRHHTWTATYPSGNRAQYFLESASLRVVGKQGRARPCGRVPWRHLK